MLEDITTHLEDMSANLVTKQKKKEEEDRLKGLAVKKAAMETYTSALAWNNYCGVNDNGFLAHYFEIWCLLHYIKSILSIYLTKDILG